jgi:hypothetical protein
METSSEKTTNTFQGHLASAQLSINFIQVFLTAKQTFHHVQPKYFVCPGNHGQAGAERY